VIQTLQTLILTPASVISIAEAVKAVISIIFKIMVCNAMYAEYEMAEIIGRNRNSEVGRKAFQTLGRRSVD